MPSHQPTAVAPSHPGADGAGRLPLAPHDDARASWTDDVPEALERTPA